MIGRYMGIEDESRFGGEVRNDIFHGIAEAECCTYILMLLAHSSLCLLFRCADESEM